MNRCTCWGCRPDLMKAEYDRLGLPLPPPPERTPSVRISEHEQASQVRMATVKGEVLRAVGQIIDETPNLTYVELATALIDVAQRQLMHQRRAEVSEDA